MLDRLFQGGIEVLQPFLLSFGQFDRRFHLDLAHQIACGTDSDLANTRIDHEVVLSAL